MKWNVFNEKQLIKILSKYCVPVSIVSTLVVPLHAVGPFKKSKKCLGCRSDQRWPEQEWAEGPVCSPFYTRHLWVKLNCKFARCKWSHFNRIWMSGLPGNFDDTTRPVWRDAHNKKLQQICGIINTGGLDVLWIVALCCIFKPKFPLFAFEMV